MNTKTVEILVGSFLLMGIIALLVLAFKVSGLSTTLIGQNGYSITAAFDNIGDLKIRAPVTVSGVRVGTVTRIELDPITFKAVVRMQIDRDQNKLPDDSSASIYTQGLLGSNYISLNPGFDEIYLKDGSQIDNTHPALILENLIGQLLFSIKDKATSKE